MRGFIQPPVRSGASTPNSRLPRSFNRTRWLWLAPVFAALALAGVARFAGACTQPPPNPPGIVLMPLSNGCVKIIICDYTTFGAGSNMFCACALRQVGPIAAVKSVGLFVGTNPAQLTPLPGFNFAPNANTTAFFNNAGGDWAGFFSPVTQDVPPNLPIKIVIVVQLAPMTTLADLAAALPASRIGTAGANANGRPIQDDHFAVLPPGPITVMSPVITGFSPETGGMGDMIQITGRGFGNNPDNICAIIMDGDTSIPLQVLEVREAAAGNPDDQIIKVMLGPIGPNAQPGPIMIALGNGNKDIFKPAYPDINVVEPAWAWVREPGVPEASSAPLLFKPVPTPIPVAGANAQGNGPGTGQVRWFFSGPPSNGVICLFLDGNWPSPSKVRVQARVHDHARGIGRDLDAYCIEFPGGGGLLECAYRICDTIRCAFWQQAMVHVNCRVDQIPGANRVKLTLSLPDGYVNWGNFNVCVESPPQKQPPRITGFMPRSGTEGTVIMFTGANFGFNPKNLCLVLMNGSVSIPLEVIEANGTTMKAVLGAIPPGVDIGNFMIACGDGQCGDIRPAFPDVRALEPIWTWQRAGAANPPFDQPFNPIPDPQNPNWQWFFSGPPTAAGELCLFIQGFTWPNPAKVRIEARAHDHKAGIGRDLRAISVEFGAPTITTGERTIIDPPTPLKCAARICDVITCAFWQQAGIVVNCKVEEVGQGVVKLTLSLPDGTIDWGNLNVCVQTPRPNDPVIESVSPLQASPGDVLIIRGKGFGNSPDNLCVVIMNGGVSIPLQAIMANDTEIHAVLGEVTPDAQPGPIMVGLGMGSFGRFRPAFFDVFVADDVWTWNRMGGPAGMSTLLVRPIPRTTQPAGNAGLEATAPPPNTNVFWFFSGPPSNGVLCLTLTNRWPAPARIQVQARVHDHRTGVGHDLAAFNIVLEGGGSLLECAKRICDVIRCAFQQQAGIIVNCMITQTTTPDGRPAVKLTLGIPGGSVDWGNFNVCVGPARQPNPDPVITGINPNTGREGDMITITGRNFGNNPDNLCVVVMSGDESVPIEVLDVGEVANGPAGTQIIKGMLGPISPDATTGPIMVGRGGGTVGRFTPVLPNIVVRKPVWVWDRNDGPATVGGVFRPIPNQQNPTNIWFWSGPPTNGMLMVVISGNWPSNSLLRIEARAHDHERRIGHDLRAIGIQFPLGGTLQQCAAQICDVIRCAFLQQAGITVNCQIVQLSPTQIKLVLTLPNGRIDWGNFNICVQAGPQAPRITGISPNTGTNGTLVTVTGVGFGFDPDDLCLVHHGPPGTPFFDVFTPLDVLSATPTQIVARLGPSAPNLPRGPLMIGVGDGQLNTPMFSFFDVFAEQPVWTWSANGPGVDSGPNLLFQPLPSPNPPGQNCPQWYFSEPPQNGVLCLFLNPNCPWPQPACIRIDARAHAPSAGIGHDLRAIDIRFEGGASTLECAHRICDVLKCAFHQAGIEVNCSVDTSAASGLIKITLALPTAPIERGNLNVCVTPCPEKPEPMITSFTPANGQEGTVVTINGSGFGNNPDNLCAVVMSGEESVPMQVLSATPNLIRAVLGAVRPNARPGPIMIGCGKGQVGRFRPAFFDIFVEEPVWTWNRTGPAGMGTNDFTPIPRTPGPNQRWFFSGPPTNGVLCVILGGPWPSPTRLRIEARAHDHEFRIGHDLRAINIGLPRGGSLLDCAYRICDVIRCAFWQQAGIQVNCQVTLLGNGQVKLTLSLPNGRVNWGNFNVCAEFQPPPNPNPTITGVTPNTGSNGTMVSIEGTGFGNNPDNLCVVVMNGDTSIPLRVIEASDTKLLARVGIVPPDAQPGPIMIGLGEGRVQPFRDSFFDVFTEIEPWTFHGGDGPSVVSTINFTPIFTPCPAGGPTFAVGFYSGRPNNGMLCVPITSDVALITKLTIEMHAHIHGPNGTLSRDIHIPCVCLTHGTRWAIANKVCEQITRALLAQGVVVNCTVTFQGGSVVVCVSLPEGAITWGSLNVCAEDGEVTCLPKPRPPLVVQRVPSFFDVFVDLCWPRSSTGLELQCTDELAGTPGSLGSNLTRWRAVLGQISATDTELRMRVPIEKVGPIRIYRLFKPPTSPGPVD